jgi:hypothetical protein
MKQEGNKMTKYKDLTCVFTPATGDAVIYSGKDPVVQGHGLKTSDGGWLDRAFGVKPGEDYFGKASIPGVGDPNSSTVKFHVFRMNAESMGCSVSELGIQAVPAKTQTFGAKPAGPAP